MEILENLAQDLRYAVRGLAKNPGFTTAVIICLAVGIGATTAFYSVLRHVVMQPMAYANADQLAIAWSLDRRLAGGDAPVSFLDWQDWRARAHTFSGLAAFRNRPGFVVLRDQSFQVELHETSSEFLPLLGISPELGRTWTQQEGEQGHPIVISYRVWQDVFSGSPSALGQTLVVSHVPYQVVGIMPLGFASPSVAAGAGIRLSPSDSVWVPFVPAKVQRLYRGNRGLRILARIRPDVSFDSAKTELIQIADSLAIAYPDVNRGISARLVPLNESVAGSARIPLLALLGAAILFFLVSCANVTSLTLARYSVRVQEFVTRAWLGANRGRLVRQLVTESLVLGAGGGVLGNIFSAVILVAVRRAALVLDVPRLASSTLDIPTLLVGILLAVISGILCGLVPALRLRFGDVPTQAATVQRTMHRGNVLFRNLMVSTQTAVTLVLMSSAVLLMLSFVRLSRSNAIEAADRTLTFQTTLSGTRWGQSPLDQQFYDIFLERLRKLPGVETVSVTTRLLQIGDPSGTDIFVDGQPPTSPDQTKMVGYTMTDSNFFRVAHQPLRTGRLFDERDRADASRVAVVNEAFVRSVLPDQEVLGTKVRASGVSQLPLEIIGVVSDTNPFQLGVAERPRIFYPYSQSPSSRFIAMVRMAPGQQLPVTAVCNILRDMDPTLPIFEVQTIDDLLMRATAAPRWSFLMMAWFASIAFVLANVGIAGAVGFAVALRTRECGIRIALGAMPNSISRALISQGLVPVVIGLAAGMAGFVLISRVLKAFLFGTSGSDPFTLAFALFVFLLVATIAAYIPARRAAKIDPASALRYE